MESGDFQAKLLKGLDWKKVLEADLYWIRVNFLNKDDAFKKRMVERWYKDFVFSTYDMVQEVDVDILFFRFLVRDDYKFFFEDVASQFSGKKAIIQDYKKQSERVNIDASKWLNEVSKFMPRLDLDCHLARACIAIKLAMYSFILRKVVNNKFKTIVLFADMQPVENLIAQYCKRLGVRTVTMQHGLYVEYENLDTINKINYEHVVSDYFLAWGNNTSKLVSKYNADVNIVNCGKPEIQMSGNSNPDDSEGYILAVLDQRIFDEQNLEMLKILFEYSSLHNVELRVKFHPSNNKKSYTDAFPELVEGGVVKKAKIVVGHTTSLIYEAMRLGSKVAKFYSPVPSIRLDASLEFDSLSKFEDIAASKSVVVHDGKEYIEYIGDESRQRYADFFHSKLICHS
ncbi:hypothetical protein EXU30_03505 [Shewanella maritima]|uniref:Uncharacterized protein n=1 Tax=Shewanella maritima TaxID=2520507 RepID=A0A411PEE6_9GAMM|nr:hypothetical protein [Shewanella maritima]QBF81868.1 hypothetical protein EXU30_03505 [Shewanella maritima]